MVSRKINTRAIGKHIGHACEGHLRGLLHHIAPRLNLTVGRALPFSAAVEPDGVLLDGRGRVSAVFVVAYWDDSKSSEKKFYRTHTEYRDVLRARDTHSREVASDCVVATIVYGSPTGWKATILSDLGTRCAPFLFLPNHVSHASLESIIEGALAQYVERWEGGHSDTREFVEQAVAQRSLTNAERKLAEIIEKLLLSRNRVRRPSVSKAVVRSVRLPRAIVQTRYRQALSMLAVFGPDEVEAWQKHRRLSLPLCERFVRRAVFLDLGDGFVSTSLTKRRTVGFVLRAPLAPDGSYAAHKPDFTSWMSVPEDVIAWTLERHRARTANPTSVFRSGTRDQAIGNVDAIATELATRGARMVQCACAGDVKQLAALLCAGAHVGAVDGHPAGDRSPIIPTWAAVASAISLAEDDRAVRGDLDSRRSSAPSRPEATNIAKRLVDSNEAVAALSDLVEFCKRFASGSLEAIAVMPRPRLLQLAEPCSMVSDFYNALVTNSSHNPINELLLPWLELRFPGVRWLGWPLRRSVTPATVLGGQWRRQWTHLALVDGRVVCAETKSVTANHWGDKSKELYDRVEELRTAAKLCRTDSLSILVVDGDLSSPNLKELGTGIGHDEIWTVDEVLDDMRRLGWRGAL